MKGLAILVSSCDKYSDLWEPFFHFFFKHWPDCPYPVHLITNHQEYPDRRVHSLKLGDDRDWSTALLDAVRAAGQEFFLYLQEDYFLLSRPDAEFLEAVVDVMRRRSIDYFRIFPCPGADRLQGDLAGYPYGRLSRFAPYRVSTQAALWRRSFAEKMIRPGESGWQLEMLGTKRSRLLLTPMLGLMDLPEHRRPPFDYFCTAILKSRWMPEAVRLCREEGLAVDFEKRGIYQESAGAARPARPGAAGRGLIALRRFLSRII